MDFHVIKNLNEEEDAYQFARDNQNVCGVIFWQVGQISASNVTSLTSKVHFYVKNKISVDISMSNWNFIDKFEGNARCCQFLFN